MEAREEFIQIYTQNIKREGAAELLEFIKTTDFFTSPASTRFHGNFEGGLLQHSIKVYKRLVKLVQDENIDISPESVAIIALLHDICKANTYKIEMRNSKVNNEWVKVPYYTYNDSLPYGHGEKSVYIVSGFMKLTRDEAMSINWHMGAFDARNNNLTSSTLAKAFQMYPIAFLTHVADLISAYLDEEIRQ
ncbi:MAG: HD domain-containing protein [Christensenellaceae bacterium]|jgi:hypothetical protein|nr:HD domain-containing protein [Christensenellaceae bacterium]